MKFKSPFILFSLCLFFNLFLIANEEDLLDLELGSQDFVLEMKKLEIPGFPYAFNPSIVKWKDKILMSFRYRPPQTTMANQIGFIFLDEEFNIIGLPLKLEQRSLFLQMGNWAQDPRLITINEQLYVVFSNIGMVQNPLIRRVFITEVLQDERGYYIEDPECFLNFDGENPSRHEKNWTPFDYQGNLHLIYSFCPHSIFRPLFGTQSCETIASTQSSIQWAWGELRGGTPALLEGDEYLTIFHTCLKTKTLHSNGAMRDHYFMGACTFSSNPPFAITRVSPEPIVGKGFYTGLAYKTWKPLHVVFPGGYISNDQFIWLAYGRQDHEVWLAKLDKNKLLESLEPVLIQ